LLAVIEFVLDPFLISYLFSIVSIRYYSSLFSVVLDSYAS